MESVDKCVIYHTNKHLISTVIDDADQSLYHDTYELHDHNIPKISVNNEEIKASEKPIQVKTSDPDYEKQRPLFAWLPLDVIKKTYELTTQYARIPMSTILQKRYISPNPAMNVHRRNEPVATDTIFSDTPAIGSGVTSAQFFVGCNSMVCDVYPLKSIKQFVNTLEDNIRDRGAMNKIISDSAQVEISNKVQDILRTLLIGSW